MSNTNVLRSSFGYFQNDGSEFVVTEKATPRGLMNYAWNERFISAVNQHGGGDGAYKERAMQFIDPAGRNLMIRDGQRYFYLRDADSGAVWSPGWHPVQAPLNSFRCTHGPGYSIIESEAHGIAASFRWFVPEKEPCEVWQISLRNTRETGARVQLFTFANFLLQGYAAYSDYFSYVWGEHHPSFNGIQACNRAVERGHSFYDAFIASDREPAGFDTSLRAFMGNFGGAHAPERVMKGACSNSLAINEKMVGVLQHVFEIQAGAEERLVVLIGASSGAEMSQGIHDRLLAPGRVDAEFEALVKRKRDLRERVRIETPNPKLNAIVNTWLKQQIQVYADVGSDNGRGFRDAMQLLWACPSFDPAYVNRMLDECLRHQFADGHTLRGWLPVDDHHYSDGPVWIAPVLDAYIKETGDASILDHVVPFFDKGEGSVWEHMLRGLRHSANDLGPRGLVRCHYGDWNDSLNGVGIKGRGESVWTTIATVFSCKVGAAVARHVRRDAVAEELLSYARSLTVTVNTNGWDGDWYLRAINDHDELVVSHTETEGRIYLLPQVWAVLADIADDERKELIFRMIDEHLETPYGSKIQHPAYTRANDRIGRLTHFTPGIWENGSPYCHANGFKIIADCVGGRGNAAYRSYTKAMPDSDGNPSTHSGCEPYVFPNQYIGPGNPRAGQTQFGWMTGTAGWYFRAVTEWIIGVRADYDGLLIDPCLPADWEHCRIERNFRGARYAIEVHNPNHREKSTVRVELDGEPLDGNKLPILSDGRKHTVKVTLL